MGCLDVDSVSMKIMQICESGNNHIRIRFGGSILNFKQTNVSAKKFQSPLLSLKRITFRRTFPSELRCRYGKNLFFFFHFFKLGEFAFFPVSPKPTPNVILSSTLLIMYRPCCLLCNTSRLFRGCRQRAVKYPYW